MTAAPTAGRPRWRDRTELGMQLRWYRALYRGWRTARPGRHALRRDRRVVPAPSLRSPAAPGSP